MWKRIIIIPVVITFIIGVLSPTHLGILDRPKVEPQQTKATMEQKRANKALAKVVASAGYNWRGKEWTCITKIFTKESRFDHFADNPKSTAFGIGQRLKETSKDPLIQILGAYKYIQHRYETPCKAWRFHLRHNWY